MWRNFFNNDIFFMKIVGLVGKGEGYSEKFVRNLGGENI